MKKLELNSINPYPCIESEIGNYVFFTDNLLQYVVYFLPTKEQYFSNIPQSPDNIYLFGFDLLSTQNKQHKYDERVRITIISILISFLKEKNKAIIYFCNTSDQKQRHRKIIFNKWFTIHNTENQYQRIDRQFIIDCDYQYYISMIFHCDISNKEACISSFTQLNDELSEK